MSKIGGVQVKTRRRKPSYKRTLKVRSIPRAHNRVAVLRRRGLSYSAWTRKPGENAEKARRKAEKARILALNMQEKARLKAIRDAEKAEKDAEKARLKALINEQKLEFRRRFNAQRRTNKLLATKFGEEGNNNNNNNNNSKRLVGQRRSRRFEPTSANNQALANMLVSRFQGTYNFSSEIKKKRQEEAELEREEARLKKEAAALRRSIRETQAAAAAAAKQDARIRAALGNNNNNNNNNNENEMMTMSRRSRKGKKGSRKGKSRKNGLANFLNNFSLGRKNNNNNNGMGH